MRGLPLERRRAPARVVELSGTCARRGAGGRANPGAPASAIPICTSSANTTSQWVSSGVDGFRVESPFVLGRENAGWVHAVGASVEGQGRGGASPCTACAAAATAGSAPRALKTIARTADRDPRGYLGEEDGIADFLFAHEPRPLVPIGDLGAVHAAPLTDARSLLTTPSSPRSRA